MFIGIKNEKKLREAERKLWRELHDDTPSARKTLKDTKSAFGDIFPEGHRHSIKPLIKDLAGLVQDGETLSLPFHKLDNVHPQAWSIILEHGRDYRPLKKAHSGFPHNEHQPAQTYCFLNSYELMVLVKEHKPTSTITYVEGFVTGPLVYPMLHAWNGKGFTGQALDWTFYASAPFSRYFGVPFTCEEYEFILGKGKVKKWKIGMLFRADNFERYEPAIREVLQRPRKRHPPVRVASVS